MRRISLALTTAALIGTTAALAAPAAQAAPATTATAVSAQACHADNAMIYTDGTRLRSKAGTSGAVLGQLYFGDPIRILRSSGGWDYVQLKSKSKGGLSKGARGWVSHKNIIPPFCGM